MLRGLIALCLLGLFAPSADAATDVSIAQAKAHFKRGTELYKKGDYTACAKEFEASFEAKPHGSILFNVAQCYERLGDARHAAQNYREYLRLTPNASDRGAVESLLRSLDSRAEPTTVAPPLPVESPPAVARVLEPTPAPLPELHAIPPAAIVEAQAPKTLFQRQRTWTWVTLGVAGAATLAGGLFGAHEMALQNQLNSVAAASSKSVENTISQTQTAANQANGFFIVGGVAFASSVSLFFLEGR